MLKPFTKKTSSPNDGSMTASVYDARPSLSRRWASDPVEAAVFPVCSQKWTCFISFVYLANNSALSPRPASTQSLRSVAVFEGKTQAANRNGIFAARPQFAVKESDFAGPSTWPFVLIIRSTVARTSEILVAESCQIKQSALAFVADVSA